MHCRATWGGTRVGQEAGVRESLGRSLCCGFHKKEWVRQSKQAEQGQDWRVSIIPVALGHRGGLWLSGALVLG